LQIEAGGKREEFSLLGKWFGKAHHPELVEGEGPFDRLTAMSLSNGQGRFSEQYVGSVTDSLVNLKGLLALNSKWFSASPEVRR